MNCRKIQSCFYDFTDGRVDQVTRSAIDLHLSNCTACRLHYEGQRRLHHDITSAAASELAGLHFRPMPFKATPSDARYRPLLGVWARTMAFGVPSFMLVCAALWLLLKPALKLAEAPVSSAYAEAYHYLEMYSGDKPGVSSFTTPLAVIIRPDAPARIIMLNGTTDVSAAFK